MELKRKFTIAPILCHYHPERKKQIETDASYLRKAGILSPYEPAGHWHPLSYYNKRFEPAELNYDVHDKEIVVIVNCFQQWPHFLMGTPEEIVVFTDNKNIEYFITAKFLNWRKARESEILNQFNFKIVYCPGKMNGKKNALSHRGDTELEGEGEKQDLKICVFKPEQFQVDENDEALLTLHVMVVKASQGEESS